MRPAISRGSSKTTGYVIHEFGEFFGGVNVQLGKPITRSARFVKSLRGLKIRGQRSDRFRVGRDSFPTQFERRIEPNTQTIVLSYERAIGLDGPRPATQ